MTDVAGNPTAYRKGEPIHPKDPILKKFPRNFGALEFPHPHYRQGRLRTPEVRS